MAITAAPCMSIISIYLLYLSVYYIYLSISTRVTAPFCSTSSRDCWSIIAALCMSIIAASSISTRHCTFLLNILEGWLTSLPFSCACPLLLALSSFFFFHRRLTSLLLPETDAIDLQRVRTHLLHTSTMLTRGTAI